ncbi:MAG TPA: permease [Candidatus Nanopelagicaceae bacterium]
MSKIYSGLLEGWWMFFETFWALVLGFTLSGLVQAFVSKSQMKSVLGDHRPKTVARASFFGMVSSSCSYAASALGKSLFSRGADFTTSMVFMFASTNLVIELGLVLLILIGWQFAAAEFVGGAVMIILLTILIPRLVPESLIRTARGSLEESSNSHVNGSSWRTKIASRQGWKDAAGYTIGDFIMLRKELIIGFIVAGLASTLVSVHIWQALFLTGHGFLSAVENAIIGPFIAFISFVCSVGNVPLAAALWQGGITFGGVIAFIFADLLAFPLVMIYRKYYGNKLALRLSLIFWLVMSLSGLITEGIFSLLSQIPHHKVGVMAAAHIGWNSTTILNVLAIIVLATVYWLYKTKGSPKMEQEFAQDPVCKMQVRIADAPAKTEHAGKMYYFCMPGCKESFLSEPAKYL